MAHRLLRLASIPVLAAALFGADLRTLAQQPPPPAADPARPPAGPPRARRVASDPTEEIKTLLAEQAAAWTRGDLDAFCAIYAEDATFVSPSGLTAGRQAILERYRGRYPDPAAMGNLTLEVLEVREFGPARLRAGASVVARWSLSGPGREPATGLTLIVLRRLHSGWTIVQDASM